jgi:predicted  nucleic acid-binding Zn-ribbon protein
VKNEELQGEWQGLIKEKEHHKVRMDEYIKGLEALKMGFEDVRLRKVAVEQKMQRARGIVFEAQWECEEKDEKIKELQAQVDAYEKRAKPKKRKRQH